VGTSDSTIDWRSLHRDHFEGERVLVTGGAGFIGSHLVEALVSLGAETRVIDDLSGGDWANLDGFADGVEQHTASILDAKRLGEAAAGCRYVFHQAALGSVPRSIEQPERYFESNVLGTVRVLEAARKAGVQRLVFASSSSVYGNPPGNAARVETDPLMPLSPYAATKASSEFALRAWADSYGLDTVALRYFNIFGPRQNANSAYAAVVAAFAVALDAGAPATIFSDGDQSRDFTYVANAVHANLLSARCPEPLHGGIFNVACGGSISVNSLYAKMAELFGYGGPPPQHAPPRPSEVRSSLADIGSAGERIGYQPLVDFEAGLARTVDWYREILRARA
jgi:UDP-glucose 4-epimerase